MNVRKFLEEKWGVKGVDAMERAEAIPGDSGLLATRLVALNRDAPEDFCLSMVSPIDNGTLHEALTEYFTGLGYKVWVDNFGTRGSCLGLWAEKGLELLGLNISNWGKEIRITVNKLS